MLIVKKDDKISLQYIKGIGPKRAQTLEKNSIKNINDLFLYFPRGYLDRSQIVQISDLRLLVERNQPVTIFAEVYRQEARRARRSNKLIFILTVKDESGFLNCLWFEGFRWLQNAFEVGEFLALSAVPSLDKLNRTQFVHPQFDRLKKADEDEPDWNKLFNTGAIIPKYKSSAELERVGLDSHGFRHIINNAIKHYSALIEETLSQSILQKHRLFDKKTAIGAIHFPANNTQLEAARYRLKFEELFFLQLMLALKKNIMQRQLRGFTYHHEGSFARKLVDSLIFELTKAQKKALREIVDDLKSPHPMHRLLQGDVGSGKTIVALCAALFAVERGLQVAFMAPTEILAEQHYRTINDLLSNVPVNVRLLVGGQRKKIHDEILEDIRKGTVNITVGTHALIEENVEFDKLGFIIMDEQHRFGVMQRANLRSKAINPDVLVMTATPIPRTLAMTLYGDLDISVIDEMPANRKPIKTAVRFEKDKNRVYQFIKEEVKNGRQAYIVFPLIEESEKIDLKAATIEYNKLQNEIFPEFKLSLLHGRMKSEVKNEIMQNFKDGKIHILVSTTVIEVGIDVPNATIMVIENAERFGLAQLHQLRGRVGRGSDQSYCVLIANYSWFDVRNKSDNLLDINDEKAKAKIRLKTMEDITDGFKISEVDLKLRGPGEFFGTRQSGLPELHIANIVEDERILLEARNEAKDIIKLDPHLRDKSNECIRKHFEEAYKEIFLLGKIS